MTGDDKHQCPRCGSTAFYRYGRTKNGRQRFICLICNRQYVGNRSAGERLIRPVCPACSDPMHIYRREAGAVRFRCKNYPSCRTYVKMPVPTHVPPPPDHA